MNRRLLRVLEWATRLVGVGLVVAGAAVARTAPVYGVPVAAVGLLFALRPYVAAELLELAAAPF